MGLPLVSAITGNQALWRPVGGLLLLLSVMVQAGLARAEDQGEGYSATVRVDATGDSVAAARELARVDGQRRALVLVIDRLSGTPDGHYRYGRKFRGRERADVSGSLSRRLHLSFPPIEGSAAGA